ncbi:MAG TPA: hypothetical protein VFS43_03030 [Polyangiaceae bacterium]|nr:hypothetical protein [Polyangiaceae bacterium]
MSGGRRALARGLGFAAAALLAGSCVTRNGIETDTFRLRVSVARADGSALPGPEDEPLCLDLRGFNPACTEGGAFLVTVEAIDLFNERDLNFNGYARLSIRPGTLLAVEGDRAEGRNVRLEAGVAEAQLIRVTGAFGDTTVWADDLGYTPVDPAVLTPACSDSVDNDGDGFVDFPFDPDCAFANDDSETGGTYASGVSAPLRFRLPTVPEAQGLGAASPYDQEGVRLEATESRLMVSRIASDGFYVSDVEPVDPANPGGELRQKPYGGLFVFSFNLPPGIAVCDRVGELSGTMTEFFGFTELTFPGFKVSEPWFSLRDSGPCRLPTPALVEPGVLSSEDTASAFLEQYEGGLVRVGGVVTDPVGQPGKIDTVGVRVASIFGPELPEVLRQQAPAGDQCQFVYAVTFRPAASNCDLDGDGRVDFTPCSPENTCSQRCFDNPACSEWSSFRRVGNFRAQLGPSPLQTILLNTGTVGGFDPTRYRGALLPWVTGTLANFSGGPLNWTIETRCSEDLVLCNEGEDEAACLARFPTPPELGTTCTRERTATDNDSESQ